MKRALSRPDLWANSLLEFFVGFGFAWAGGQMAWGGLFGPLSLPFDFSLPGGIPFTAGLPGGLLSVALCLGLAWLVAHHPRALGWIFSGTVVVAVVGLAAVNSWPDPTIKAAGPSVMGGLLFAFLGGGAVAQGTLRLRGHRIVVDG